MTESEVTSILDKWWASKRCEIKSYIDSRLGIAKTKGTVFVEPTVQDVMDYVKDNDREWSEGNSAESFVNFYGAKGWMIGKNKMKDWHKAVCNKWTIPKQDVPEQKKKVVYCAGSGKPKSICQCERCK